MSDDLAGHRLNPSATAPLRFGVRILLHLALVPLLCVGFFLLSGVIQTCGVSDWACGISRGARLLNYGAVLVFLYVSGLVLAVLAAVMLGWREQRRGRSSWLRMMGVVGIAVSIGVALGVLVFLAADGFHPWLVGFAARLWLVTMAAVLTVEAIYRLMSALRPVRS